MKQTYGEFRIDWIGYRTGKHYVNDVLMVDLLTFLSRIYGSPSFAGKILNIKYKIGSGNEVVLLTKEDLYPWHSS